MTHYCPFILLILNTNLSNETLSKKEKGILSKINGKEIQSKFEELYSRLLINKRTNLEDKEIKT